MSMDRRLHRVPFEDPLSLWGRGLDKLKSRWVMTYPFAGKGRGLSIHHTCRIERRHAHRIRLGNHETLCKDVWLNVVALANDEDEPLIVLEDGCGIGPWTTISAKNSIYLEQDVIIGPSVLITDHGEAYEDVTLPVRQQGKTQGGRIRVGQGSWIGHGAAIVCTKGELVLGRNCVVAANALVTRSFPPYSVISGNPARVVKQFDPLKKVWVLGSTRSVES